MDLNYSSLEKDEVVSLHSSTSVHYMSALEMMIGVYWPVG